MFTPLWKQFLAHKDPNLLFLLKEDSQNEEFNLEIKLKERFLDRITTSFLHIGAYDCSLTDYTIPSYVPFIEHELSQCPASQIKHDHMFFRKNPTQGCDIRCVVLRMGGTRLDLGSRVSTHLRSQVWGLSSGSLITQKVLLQYFFHFYNFIICHEIKILNFKIYLRMG